MPDKTPDLDALNGEIYRNWEKAMTTWWDQVLESPAFLGGMGQQLSATSQARGAYERAVNETMEKLHLPTRGDVVRLARVCTLLEERLLAQEDLLLAMKDRMDTLEKAALEARIEAAEARVELRERLDALKDTLGAPAASAAPQRKTRGAT
ncbi:MAG: hypothetical protein ACOZNI_24970 [Myxococcota bacterium]